MNVVFVKHPEYKYTKLSEVDNPMYVAKYTGNDIEIISGTKEELIAHGFPERNISNSLKRIEDSAATFLANAKLRKMTAEELYNKIQEKREKA